MVSTPDDGDVTLEIKCPYTCKEMGREEMLAKKGFYLQEFGNGDIELKKNHHYYYQI